MVRASMEVSPPPPRQFRSSPKHGSTREETSTAARPQADAKPALRRESASFRREKTSASPFTPATICILLVAAVALVFAQTARFQSVNYDDGLYVYENDHVEQGITWAGMVWSFSEKNATGNCTR